MPVIAVWIFALFAILIVGLGIFISYYEYHGIGPQEGVFRNGNSDGPKIAAITFDDGPSPEYTPQILSILADKKVNATFFMTGQMVEEYPEIAAAAARAGHEVGNHTYSHVNMVLLTPKNLINEIEKGESVIEAATGIKPSLFRPPRGLFNNNIRKALVSRGYQIILWSVSAADWGPLSSNQIARRIKKYSGPGAVILFHDGGALVKNKGGRRDKTVAVLPEAIDFLRAEGYELVTIGEMLKKINV